jgi:uncharacterized membrane protein YphA (DoxX/SURF4 family)
MNSVIQKILSAITQNTILYFRGILFLTFLGHGLVSLGYSTGYELHYRIFESVNFFHFNTAKCLTIIGWGDVFLAVSILSGLIPRVILSLALVYLSSVAVAGYLFYHHTTGSLFGIAESFRRFAWIFYAIFLWIYASYQKKYFSLLRMGIGFAFLAHGLASIGFFGLKGAHIELASQVLSEEVANNVIFYSGFSDTLLGLLMLNGIVSRPAAAIGSVWLVVVVYLSYLAGFPDAVFRSGFLFSCIYVALDARCHTLIWKKGIVEG